MIPFEGEMADDLWYSHQGSSFGRVSPPVMVANDVFMNANIVHDARPLLSAPIPEQAPSHLATTAADRDRDVQQMASKAERARKSRQKRKAYVSNLEAEARTLTEQLRSLSAHEAELNTRLSECVGGNRIVMKHMEAERQIDEHLDALRQRQQVLMGAIQSSMRGDVPVDDLVERRLSDQVMDLLQTCRTIWASFDSYLKLAESTLAFGRGHPSDALWTLFMSDHSQADELHALLGLSDDQLEKLGAFRDRFTALGDELAGAAKLIQEFRTQCDAMLKATDDEIRELIAITGPYRCCKILKFVQEQTWCMEMLKSVFSQFINSTDLT